jgi:succinyl-diaminopimelate desuccinylase
MPRGPDPVALAQGLIRCPSVTPAEGGALDLLESVLKPAGFACHRLPFSAPGTPDVDNLLARVGEGAPHLCFAGHTDVVPPGDEGLWSHPPFAGEVADGWLYGRGAVDMKGAVAAFAAAVLGLLEDRGGTLPGSVSLLITGDEEGPAVNGTVKVLEWMAANGHTPDHCLLGEPSNPAALGDAIKIGRRGSHSGRLTVTGTQGHVAYPEKALNPIPGLLAVLNRFLAEPLDHGTNQFAASNLEVTSIDVGNPAENIIPARAEARFNIRFNDLHRAETLVARLRDEAAEALSDTGLGHELTFSGNAEAFVTKPGPLVDALSAVVEDVTGRTPELSTGGGTSDARFIFSYCPVVEFGLVNATIHQVDERTSIADLEALTVIYRRFIARYFEVFD